MGTHTHTHKTMLTMRSACLVLALALCLSVTEAQCCGNPVKVQRSDWAYTFGYRYCYIGQCYSCRNRCEGPPYIAPTNPDRQVDHNLWKEYTSWAPISGGPVYNSNQNRERRFEKKRRLIERANAEDYNNQKKLES